mmetsp:Transcript_18377/g.24635  ORF Transcript_18377/g.24635 Transcript_18377/m.24635 type:complete len:89 (+) Transcript_18377:672-938(+)
MEEANQCSGICEGINDDRPLELYLFSNINDGDPVRSCRAPLRKTIEDHIGYFETVYDLTYILTGAVIVILIVMLACQVYLFCRNKCKK